MITLKRFRRLEAAIVASGYADSITWSETVAPPADADTFAREVIYVILNSGMATSVALIMFERCMRAIDVGAPMVMAISHKGKAAAISRVWAGREQLFAAFEATDDVLAFCAALPFIGPVTARHLAKNLGADVAKADVHLQRLADRDGLDVDALCARLAKATGYRVATVDTILWRASQLQLLDSAVYRDSGWQAATPRLRRLERQQRRQRAVAIPCIISGDTIWPLDEARPMP